MSFSWEKIVSDHLIGTELNVEHYVFLLFQTSSIMAQEDINYLGKKKEELVSVAWENIVSANGEDTA